MTIIGILAAIAVPALRDSPKRAREATLRADLFTFRSVIDQYKGDKGMYPVDLDVLIKDGYMRKHPARPHDEGRRLGAHDGGGAEPARRPERQPPARDHRRPQRSKEKALDGTLYSEW